MLGFGLRRQKENEKISFIYKKEDARRPTNAVGEDQTDGTAAEGDQAAEGDAAKEIVIDLQMR